MGLSKDLEPNVLVAFVPGYRWKPWKKSNGWSKNPAEFPGTAMLRASSDWRLCGGCVATVTQATRSYGRNMGLSGQGSAEYWLPKESWSINFPRFSQPH